MTAPVVLIAFNRPDAVRRTLAAIREAAPQRLFLLADGPRAGIVEDVERCDAVRAELERIDWPCEVHRLYREQNVGLDASVELGLDWVFAHTEEAIILEDDCLPNADFFRFCSLLLERYRDTSAVWQISGRAPSLRNGAFAGASYAFTASGPIWGWATWRRSWQRHRAWFPRHHDGTPPPPGFLLDLHRSRLLTAPARRYFRHVARDGAGAEVSWDSHWALSGVRARGLVAIPNANLVINIGLGVDGTHCSGTLPQRPLEPIAWPLEHPTELDVNPTLEGLAERILVLYMGRTARFLAGRLRDNRAGAVVAEILRTVRDRSTRKVVG